MKPHIRKELKPVVAAWLYFVTYHEAREEKTVEDQQLDSKRVVKGHESCNDHKQDSIGDDHWESVNPFWKPR